MERRKDHMAFEVYYEDQNMRILKVKSNVYHILHREDGTYSTFIFGEKSGLLIDTGYGKFSLDQAIRKITDKPYEVLNTHGHPDHILGNGQYEWTWLNRLDESLARTHEHEQGQAFNYKWLEIGQSFDLGNVLLEVVALPGHTPGSVGILYEAERLLIAGDALNPYLWMFLPESSTLSEYRKTVEYAKTLPFDNYLASHTDLLINKSFLDTKLKNIDTLQLDETTKEVVLDIDTYKSILSEKDMHSVIVFAKKSLL